MFPHSTVAKTACCVTLRSAVLLECSHSVIIVRILHIIADGEHPAIFVVKHDGYRVVCRSALRRYASSASTAVSPSQIPAKILMKYLTLYVVSPNQNDVINLLHAT